MEFVDPKTCFYIQSRYAEHAGAISLSLGVQNNFMADPKVHGIMMCWYGWGRLVDFHLLENFFPV
jgi:hypothetical protein